MRIDAAEVLRIARLARIRIEVEEADRLAEDLARIVEYVDSLAAVELPPDVDALTYFDQDVHREDRVAECLPHEDAMRNAPETDGTYFVVPKVVTRDSTGS